MFTKRQTRSAIGPEQFGHNEYVTVVTQQKCSGQRPQGLPKPLIIPMTGVGHSLPSRVGLQAVRSSSAPVAVL